MIKKLLILFTVIAGTLLSVHAQDIPEPMTPKRIVNDFTGLFSTQERAGKNGVSDKREKTTVSSF